MSQLVGASSHVPKRSQIHFLVRVHTLLRAWSPVSKQSMSLSLSLSPSLSPYFFFSLSPFLSLKSMHILRWRIKKSLNSLLKVIWSIFSICVKIFAHSLSINLDLALLGLRTIGLKANVVSPLSGSHIWRTSTLSPERESMLGSGPQPSKHCPDLRSGPCKPPHQSLSHFSLN